MPVLHPDSDPSVCWQRQVRDRYLSEGTPPVPHLDLKRSVVRSISRKLAERIILRYEWLGRMAPTSLHYGLFFGPYCAGVVCIAVGSGHSGTNTHKFFGVPAKRLSVLARGACVHWAPTGANSRLVSVVCRLCRRDSLASLIVAYADTQAGEIGTIYQACNWIYVGPSQVYHQWISPGGRTYDERTASHWARRAGLNRSSVFRDHAEPRGWTLKLSNPKHRYVHVLDRSDRDLVARIESMRLPYPKRAGRLDGEAPVDQTG